MRTISSCWYKVLNHSWDRFWALFAGSQNSIEGLLVFLQNMITYEEDATQRPYKALEHIEDFAELPKSFKSKSQLFKEYNQLSSLEEKNVVMK